MLRIVITDMSGQCGLKNIRYRGNQALPGGQKGGEMGPKCTKSRIIPVMIIGNVFIQFELRLP